MMQKTIHIMDKVDEAMKTGKTTFEDITEMKRICGILSDFNYWYYTNDEQKTISGVFKKK
jgi:hypothetical protein